MQAKTLSHCSGREGGVGLKIYLWIWGGWVCGHGGGLERASLIIVLFEELGGQITCKEWRVW